ncbi:E3 ubiquitin-protein ligase RMA1-like [Zingiber officinale]|uniref:E3 ubiquitin-protein ligase RMA1-like n=1 Tax=Zingiber officinale TaxID=94328 RepID=UPI001C4B9BEF|nr:E3 ubiquitin-protein ligase RMA1-like [Zingiber officinale]
MAHGVGVCSCAQTMDKPPMKEPPSNSSTLGVTEPARSVDACFDCNICFDCAVEPVVTLCGHLYCWPCVYQWIQLESISHKQCPVCKARLSQDTLVPLYGCGRLQQTAAKGDSDVPRRPTTRMPYDHAPLSYPMHQQQPQFHQDNGHVSGSFGLGGFVSDDPPFVSGIHGESLHHEQSYYLTLNGKSTRLRQLMHLECLLHQIWIFLFLCVVVCLLLF